MNTRFKMRFSTLEQFEAVFGKREPRVLLKRVNIEDLNTSKNNDGAKSEVRSTEDGKKLNQDVAKAPLQMRKCEVRLKRLNDADLAFSKTKKPDKKLKK